MTRVTQPGDAEPIRLIETKAGHRYRVVLDTSPAGVPRRQITRTFNTIREARKFVNDTRADLVAGSFTPPSTETLAQLCERWLESRRDVRPVTLEGYRHWLAPALRHLGSQKVQALTVTDVERLTAWLSSSGGRRGQGLGATSVRSTLVALGQALDLAAREGTVNRNVARLVRRPRTRTRSGTDLLHWQPEQLLRFREHADTHALAGAWRLTLAGMTRADVLGLRWSDIDLETGIVLISQGRVALSRSDHVDDPKSRARRRAVPVEQMHPGTVGALRELWAQQARDQAVAGSAYVGSGMLVVDSIGRPVRPEWYSDEFRRVSAAAGVPSITLHSVRHSLAFWLHREGVAPADAAALLGHTVEVYLSTYLPHSGAIGIASAAAAIGRSAAAGQILLSESTQVAQ